MDADAQAVLDAVKAALEAGEPVKVLVLDDDAEWREISSSRAGG